jgi:hypothetical protein
MSYENGRQSHACAARFSAPACGWSRLARACAPAISERLYRGYPRAGARAGRRLSGRDGREAGPRFGSCRNGPGRTGPGGGPAGVAMRIVRSAQRERIGRSCRPPLLPPAAQPRPTNGILVAMMVMNCTLVSSGRLAIVSTAWPTWSGSMTASGRSEPSA